MSKSFFAGTAYLAMPGNEHMQQLVAEGIRRYGLNYGASRNNPATPDIYDIAENVAAKRSGADDAIIVSSGYLAAQLVIQYYLADYKCIYAPDTHPALWVGPPKPPVCTFTKWSETVVREINQSQQPVMIISNSLNNLYPEIYDFRWVSRIAPDREVILLIDDSHGLGITGLNGGGIYSQIPEVGGIKLIVIASMAKALGIDAGLIIGSTDLISELRLSPVYAGSSPPSPAMLYAYANASDVYANELGKLQQNMLVFSEMLEGVSGIDYLQNFPVYLVRNAVAGQYLQKMDIVISSFAYPDPTGPALNRIVLNSTHSSKELAVLGEALRGLSKALY